MIYPLVRELAAKKIHVAVTCRVLGFSPQVPPVKGARGRPMRDHRLLIEGATHRYRTGGAWRDLPVKCGPWHTVWNRHHRFPADGTWDRGLAALQAQADADGDL